VELDSNALIVCVLFDSTNLDRRAVEFNAVRFRHCVAHGADKFCDVVQLVTRPSGEVDVDGWPGDWRPPGREQKRTLEDKSIREWRLRQSIQEPLHCEILEEFLKGLALRTRLVEQMLPNRRAYIAIAHRTASRYGCMTLWTRLI